MTSIYISGFIKIRSPICEINKPHFSRFPLPLASPTTWLSRGNDCYPDNLCRSASQPPNFHRSSTSTSTELTKALEIHPSSPKESKSGHILSITYIRLGLILPTSFHPYLSTLSDFKNFLFPPPTPPPPIFRSPTGSSRSGLDLKEKL